MHIWMQRIHLINMWGIKLKKDGRSKIFIFKLEENYQSAVQARHGR
jgi:hypothetical protein